MRATWHDGLNRTLDEARYHTAVMEFRRQTTEFRERALAGENLCDALQPGVWLMEAGYTPPPAHRPERLLAGRHCEAAAAISLSTATLLETDLGQAVIAWLQAAGCAVDPLAGLAVHELLLNAAIHGNLEIASGPSRNWYELSARQSMIAAGLQDEARAARVLTVAVGWTARKAALLIADQGAGYRDAPEPATPAERRGAGRGLKIARRAGRVEVLDGGRCTALLLVHAPAADAPVLRSAKPDVAAPIIVLDPDTHQSRRIADWLRSAGLGAILTARTCEGAIFMLGRQPVALLILDETLPLSAELRVLRHITADHTRTPPPLVRLISAESADSSVKGRATATDVVRKPLDLHEIVVRVGTALQRNDLLGHLDKDRHKSADHLEPRGACSSGCCRRRSRSMRCRMRAMPISARRKAAA